MATVLISLVGGRPLPNILLTLHYKPDQLYLIASQDSVGSGRDLEKTLAALPAHLLDQEPKPVHPYRLDETITCCQAIISQHAGDRIIINTTLGPKTMAFGAYDAARAAKEQGVDVEVCYLAREGIVCIYANTIEPVDISLREYFTSYGWSVCVNTDAPPAQLTVLTELLMCDIRISCSLLQLLRSHSGGKGKRTCRCKRRMGDGEFELLQAIERLGLVSSVQRNDATTAWTINGDEEGRMLLSGDWLEYYVYGQARDLSDQKGQPLFTECGWGVEDTGGRGEIDFAGMFQGQMLIASCKTENGLKREWFEELHSKTEQLGKGMCSGLLISTVARSSYTEQDLERIRKWAHERQIVLLLAEDLPSVGAVLSKIISLDVKAEPIDVRVYPRI